MIAAPGALGAPQVGVVAGRRVGGAVRRNRAKRRLRAAISEVDLADGMAYIVIAGPEVPEVDFRQLTMWIASAVAGTGAGSTKENE